LEKFPDAALSQSSSALLLATLWLILPGGSQELRRRERERERERAREGEREGERERERERETEEGRARERKGEKERECGGGMSSAAKQAFCLQGHLAHEEPPPPTHQDLHRAIHRPTVGSQGGAAPHERGTPAW